VKEWSVFDKKGGFNIQLITNIQPTRIRISHFDFNKNESNVRLAMHLNEVEASSIADKINSNLRNISEWKDISIIHKYTPKDTNQEVTTTFSINKWVPPNTQIIKLILSSIRGRTKLSTTVSPEALRFLAKVLNHFALESLVVPDKVFKSNSYQQKDQAIF